MDDQTPMDIIELDKLNNEVNVSLKYFVNRLCSLLNTTLNCKFEVVNISSIGYPAAYAEVTLSAKSPGGWGGADRENIHKATIEASELLNPGHLNHIYMHIVIEWAERIFAVEAQR